ncbi:hypothetical protein [Gracilibacillus sp. JCM 18860]|uniref:hypothetical protein n=1 Tax=Gracilibacillus sp. JCM 18860 TaxID=1306159 RepID=UPI0006D1BB4D
MKNKKEFLQTVECYLVMLLLFLVFFGSIYIAGEISGSNEMLSELPDFSWDMINTWDEIKNKSN